MAAISGTTGDDFVHRAGDGLTPPAGYNDIPEATEAYDYFYGQTGGNDRVFLGGGNDYFYFERGFNAADRLDGGADFDYLYLFQPTTVSFNSTTIRNIESVRLDAVYSGNYRLTFHDGNFAAGLGFNIDGTSLEASTTLFVDLSAETDAGNAYVYGGSGGDTLIGGTETDNLYGYAGNDSLVGGEGTDYLYGGLGTDTLAGGNGNDGYYDVDPQDTIVETASGGTDYVSTDLPSYTLPDQVENLYLEGHQPISATGNGGNNYLYGNDNNNTLAGAGGNDYLVGQYGDDLLTGGPGDDTLYGSVGNDTLFGNGGTDSLYGESGDDTYVDPEEFYAYEQAHRGTDTIQTGKTWTLEPSPDIENLTLTGNTAINGRGNAAANVISGNSNANSLVGLENNDRLVGNNGNDTLNGGDGNDTLVGGDGQDLLLGGKGNDVLNGGADPDTFRFGTSNHGNDTINAFSVSQDRFDLSGEAFTLATIVGSDTRLTYSGGTILVTGIANDDEAFWNDLVLTSGMSRVAQSAFGEGLGIAFGELSGHDGAALRGLAHGDYVLA